MHFFFQGIKITILGIFILASLWAGVNAFNQILKMEDDNVFEEAVEDYVESKTGLDFDFTPSSKE